MSSMRMTPTFLIKILAKLAEGLRRKRFALFRTLTSPLARPIKILDIGGTQEYWESMNFTEEADVTITLFNMYKIDVSHPNFKSVVGDARDIRCFKDKEFDLVFSNSVIEHVGDYEQQLKMAKEIRRLGKMYFVQTPNYFFPIEPHFQFPLFQFFPLKLKVFLLGRFELGWYKKITNEREAVEVVNENKLLTEQEFKSLFPEANMYKEKLFGLTKSFVAYYTG